MKITNLILLIASFALIAGLTHVLIPLQYTDQITQLENIHGLPYPQVADSIHVTEDLAHADIYLKSSPLAKQITLNISFIPRDIQNLSVGIRENSFWLSYQKHELYRAEQPTPNYTRQTKSIAIPLTDKLPDHDGSVDLMFFASSHTATTDEANEIWWELTDLSYQVDPAFPTRAELKNYTRSVLTNEVPL